MSKGSEGTKHVLEDGSNEDTLKGPEVGKHVLEKGIILKHESAETANLYSTLQYV